MPRRLAHRVEYAISELSESDWDELICLTFEPFEFGPGETMTRGQWLALADMALGKAQRIDHGDYDMPGDIAGSRDAPVWSSQLRNIAAVIRSKFKPGDGRL